MVCLFCSHEPTSFPKACVKKIHLAPTGKSPLRTCAILSYQEGRLAIATNAGQGAVDADSVARRARVFSGRQSRVVPAPPILKFLQSLPRFLVGTSKSQAALELKIAVAPSFPKFVKVGRE
jgi:hypothetical protein